VTGKCVLLSIALALTLGLLACACAEPVEVAPPGKIAFVTKREGNDEICVMDADGSSQQRVTNNPALDWGPSWSPEDVWHESHLDTDSLH
jgi:TolB protein